MSEMNLGTTGAKIQSWRHDNPRDVLREIVEEDPKAPRQAVWQEFAGRVREEVQIVDLPGIIVSMMEYWFANNYRSIMDERRAGRPSRQRAPTTADSEAVAAVRGKLNEKIEQKAAMFLLDMVLPNGKALRDCTGAECSKLGQHMGAWLKAIARKVKSNQIVGDVLSEDVIRRLYEQHKK